MRRPCIIFIPSGKTQPLGMNRSLATMGIRRTYNFLELQQKNNDVPWDLNRCHDSSWPCLTPKKYLQHLQLFGSQLSRFTCFFPHWNVRPSPLVTGHSFRLDARDVGLTDAQLNACRVCMGQVHVEAVDLEVQSSACETVLGFGDVFASKMVVVDADSANGIWYCRMNLNDHGWYW